MARRGSGLVWLCLCALFWPAQTTQDIWLLGFSAFTGGRWDAGESVRFAGEMMVKLINDEGRLLPGYRLRVLWQDERCSGSRASKVLVDNLHADSYYQYPPLPHTDSNGDGRISTDETLSRTTLVLGSDLELKPVGVLACGCSDATQGIIHLAYRLRIPIVSGTNTRAVLSDREAFPNFFRVIAHEGTGPEAMCYTIQMLGINRTAVTVSHDQFKVFLSILVAKAAEVGMTFVGRNLNHVEPGLRGVQLASTNWQPAIELLQVLKSTGVRIVITPIYAMHLQLILCAQARQGYGGLIWLQRGFNTGLWMSPGLSGVPEANCNGADILGVISGGMMLQANVWRQDKDAAHACTSSVDVNQFYRDYYTGQGAPIGVQGHVHQNYTLMLESPAAADAVCMTVLMLSRLLFEKNFTLAEVAARTPAVYEQAVALLGNSDFGGLQGQVQFEPGNADSTLNRMAVFQIQTPQSPCVGAGMCGPPESAVALQIGTFERPQFIFREGIVLKFHFEDEAFPVSQDGRLSGQLQDFSACPIGQEYHPPSRSCRGCGPGQTYMKVLGSCVCAAGTHAGNGSCVPCAAGTYAAEVGTEVCQDCPSGRFAAEEGQSECMPCVVGSFAAHPGTVHCSECGHGRRHPHLWSTVRQLGSEWTYAEGSTSPEACRCDRNARKDASGECIECGEGLHCPGMEVVLLKRGYQSEEDLSVFLCREANFCIGGPPGKTCNTGRRGVSCTRCQEGLAPASGGTCAPCGGTHLIVVISSLVVALGLLTSAYFFTNKSVTHNLEFINLIICIGLMVTSLQVFSVVGTIELVWLEPLDSVMRALSRLSSLSVEVLQLDCVDVQPVGRFVFKVTLILGACAYLVCVHFVYVKLILRGKLAEFRHVIKCVLGTLLTSFSITVVTAILAPLQCEPHPNLKWTARESPGVVCWESSEHLHMAIIGIIAFVFIPVPHLIKCILLVRQFPSRMAMGDTRFLSGNAFLFSRFRPETYWYSLAIVFRSLWCASLPVLPSTTAQLVLLQLAMIFSLFGALRYQPLRTRMGNAMEIATSFLLLIFCGLTSLFARPHMDDLQQLAYVSTVLLACIIVPLPLYSTCVLARKVFFKPRKMYQYFLCHHKAGAGAFTRLMKLCLAESPTVTHDVDRVFIDSDNLENLGMLFGFVESCTECLVIIASRDVFKRPWCAGEMCTARLNKIRTVVVAMPDMCLPAGKFLKAYDEVVPEIDALTAEGINLIDIHDTMAWIHTLEQVPVAVPLDSASVYNAAAQVSGLPEWPRKATMGHGPAPSILCDPDDLEAVSAAYVLQKLIIPYQLQVGEGIPTVMTADEDVQETATSIILLLSSGLLEQDAVLTPLTYVAQRSISILPVTLADTFRFPTQATLDEIRVSKGDAAADVVTQAFKEISVSFQPQHASLTSLKMGASHVSRRLKVMSLQAEHSMKGEPSMRGEPSMKPPLMSSKSFKTEKPNDVKVPSMTEVSSCHKVVLI